MSTLVSIIKAVLMPHTIAEKKDDPPDLQAFQESRDRLHKSTKRLVKALNDDGFGAMAKRMSNGSGRKRK